LESLLILVEWLLDRGYDVRLLIGDLTDPVSEFRRLVARRLPTHDSARIMDAARVSSVEQLLAEIGDTDLVVATRFHNLVFALLNNKPTVSISFHAKCASLMSAMGMSEYCLQIERLKSDDLIEKVLDVERNSSRLKSLIARKCEEFREALEEQYGVILASARRPNWTWSSRASTRFG
jgi:polysaccharide pyruvyl transferase WcaK-like protein